MTYDQKKNILVVLLIMAFFTGARIQLSGDYITKRGIMPALNRMK